MRKILYQWAAVGILSLIGWGVDVMPNNTSWIPSVILWIIAGIWFIATLVYLWKNRGKKQHKLAKDTESERLTDVLIEMHRRLVHLKDTRLKQRFDRQEFEDACPLFFDKLGIIPLKDWDSWDKKTAKRLRRLVPKDPEKKARFGWRYRVIVKAQEIVKDLVNSREWAIDDLEKAARHLDSIHMGIGELYENDKQWQGLFDKAKPYMVDSVLRELIDKYITHSYTFCSVLLMVNYGNRLAKNRFSRMLCSALVGSNISPTKIETALSEILEQIECRVNEIGAEKSELTVSRIKVVGKYEDNKGECGLIFCNTNLSNLSNCQARLIDLAFEVLHPRYSLERYPKAEDLICPQHIGGAGNGKIPLFRWGFSGGSKDLEIVYKSDTQKIGYGILNVPILVLLNIWADNVQNTYAVCKLEDRLGWGYELSVLETGILKGGVKLATYQKPNPDIEGSQTE